MGLSYIKATSTRPGESHTKAKRNERSVLAGCGAALPGV
jgi:hypothetical protein